MLEVAQGPGRGGAPAPIGIVYDTAMSRPDAALALAAMHAMSNKREARLGSVCVTGVGLKTAIFCDIVARFLHPGPVPLGNNALAVGFPDVTPMPADPPMVLAAVDRKKDNGDPQYARSIARLSDTSQAEAVLRNGVIFSAESAVLLSASAIWLTKTLDLQGAKDEYKRRVKRLVIVDAGAPQSDIAALRRVIAEWPTPVFFCGRDVGEALTLPAATIEKAFAWAAAHPVMDAYRAFKPAPYDVPAHDLAAMHFIVHPDSGLFNVSEPGTLSVSDAGQTSFAAGSGTARRVTLVSAKKAEAIEALMTVAAAEPPPPPAPRGRGPA